MQWTKGFEGTDHHFFLYLVVHDTLAINFPKLSPKQAKTLNDPAGFEK